MRKEKLIQSVVEAHRRRNNGNMILAPGVVRYNFPMCAKCGEPCDGAELADTNSNELEIHVWHYHKNIDGTRSSVKSEDWARFIVPARAQQDGKHREEHLRWAQCSTDWFLREHKE